MPEAASVLAPSFVRALPSSSRPLAELIERLRTPSDRGLAFGLHETTAAARPYLLAGIYGALGGTILVVGIPGLRAPAVGLVWTTGLLSILSAAF